MLFDKHMFLILMEEFNKLQLKIFKFDKERNKTKKFFYNSEKYKKTFLI